MASQDKLLWRRAPGKQRSAYCAKCSFIARVRADEVARKANRDAYWRLALRAQKRKTAAVGEEIAQTIEADGIVIASSTGAFTTATEMRERAAAIARRIGGSK